MMAALPEHIQQALVRHIECVDQLDLLVLLFNSPHCAVLLWRGYRQSGARLLFWSALCFAFMTLGNALLIVDLTTTVADLMLWRALPHVGGLVAIGMTGLPERAGVKGMETPHTLAMLTKPF